MTNHNFRIPQAALNYFTSPVRPTPAPNDLTIEEFFVGGRWIKAPKGVLTVNRIRSLRTIGATFVAIRHEERIADFPIQELTR